MLLTQIIFLLVIQGCSSKKELNVETLSDKWISLSTPRCEVWFQNWGTYQRLFIILDDDSTEVIPSPYVTEKKGKPYLKPKPYKKVGKQQLKGNLYWNEEPSWKDGIENTARWEVDRANPNLKLPQHYKVSFTLDNGELIMDVNREGKPNLELTLSELNSY
tara:strand:+ start:94 stop:576 length:483 start_codon:yes stop_codon:yes gene_type:complete